MVFARSAITLLPVALLCACPSEQQRQAEAARQLAACRDTICAGDILPSVEDETSRLVKLNGHWFAAPRAYFSGSGRAAFYWPSKAPLRGIDGRGQVPGPGEGETFETITIEIFFRSNNIPTHRRDYRLIQAAEHHDWIESRRMLRQGLERIEMKHVTDASGSYIDNVSYYVATELVNPEGLPPVASCFHGQDDGAGGTGFMWKDGIWVGTRMNQRRCAEWPEIYQELVKVLRLLEKIE